MGSIGGDFPYNGSPFNPQNCHYNSFLGCVTDTYVKCSIPNYIGECGYLDGENWDAFYIKSEDPLLNDDDIGIEPFMTETGLLGHFKNANLKGITMRGVFPILDFSGSDLMGADLSYSAHTSSKFINAKLNGVKADYTNMAGANFSGADMGGIYLRYSTVNRANFTGANLHWADLTQSDLSQSVFNGAVLVGATFRYAKVNSSIFVGANLFGVRFTSVDARDADFRGADMTKAEVGGALLNYSILCPTPGLNFDPNYPNHPDYVAFSKAALGGAMICYKYESQNSYEVWMKFGARIISPTFAAGFKPRTGTDDSDRLGAQAFSFPLEMFNTATGDALEKAGYYLPATWGALPVGSGQVDSVWVLIFGERRFVYLRKYWNNHGTVFYEHWYAGQAPTTANMKVIGDVYLLDQNELEKLKMQENALKVAISLVPVAGTIEMIREKGWGDPGVWVSAAGDATFFLTLGTNYLFKAGWVGTPWMKGMHIANATVGTAGILLHGNEIYKEIKQDQKNWWAVAGNIGGIMLRGLQVGTSVRQIIKLHPNLVDKQQLTYPVDAPDKSPQFTLYKGADVPPPPRFIDADGVSREMPHFSRLRAAMANKAARDLEAGVPMQQALTDNAAIGKKYLAVMKKKGVSVEYEYMNYYGETRAPGFGWTTGIGEMGGAEKWVKEVVDASNLSHWVDISIQDGPAYFKYLDDIVGLEQGTAFYMLYPRMNQAGHKLSHLKLLTSKLADGKTVVIGGVVRTVNKNNPLEVYHWLAHSDGTAISKLFSSAGLRFNSIPKTANSINTSLVQFAKATREALTSMPLSRGSDGQVRALIAGQFMKIFQRKIPAAFYSEPIDYYAMVMCENTFAQKFVPLLKTAFGP